MPIQTNRLKCKTKPDGTIGDCLPFLPTEPFPKVWFGSFRKPCTFIEQAYLQEYCIN